MFKRQTFDVPTDGSALAVLVSQTRRADLNLVVRAFAERNPNYFLWRQRALMKQVFADHADATDAQFTTTVTNTWMAGWPA